MTLKASPDAPENFQQSSTTSDLITLSWIAADYVGVESDTVTFNLYKDGLKVVLDDDTSLAYSDNEICGGETYTYDIEAKNSKGFISDQVTLILTAPTNIPDAPIINVDNHNAISPTEYYIEFDEPNCTNGAIINDYTIEYSTDNFLTLTSTTLTNNTVTLNSNTEYQTRIRAESNLGTGTSSNQITINTPRDVPTKPVGVGKAISSTIAQINVTIEDEGFSSLTHAFASIDNSTWFKSKIEPPEYNFVLEGLTPNPRILFSSSCNK